MANIKVLKSLIVFLAISADTNLRFASTGFGGYSLNEAHIRHVRHRCLQLYPQADTLSYNDTAQTHCFLQCFIHNIGLMDLKTRGLNTSKFIDIWEHFEADSKEDNCLDAFDFGEPLSGKCSDSYRKLMEFRHNCVQLFEYIFTTNSSWKSEDSGGSKKVGQSATEFCDFLEEEFSVGTETSKDEELTLMSQYKDKLKCIFENFYYLDAYDKVNELEILLSYQEANEDSPESRAIIQTCAHRANSKYFGDLVLELQKCLKALSPRYDKVYKLRDETSRQY